MKIRVPIAALLAAAALPLGALDVVGKITYLEGRVEIVRDGETLAASLVKEGLEVANFDLLKTGSDGQAELRITSAAAPATTITVSPRTQFSVEIGKTGFKKQTTIDLVAGSVAMKCAKLTGSQGLGVQTETAVMGVRGTSFAVTAPASGDILVTCDEGEVECTDEKGETLLAAAGQAIEKRAGKRLARLAVAAAALGQYRRDWQDARASELKTNALGATVFFAIRYRLAVRQFNDDFAVLEKARDVISTWESEDRAGRIGSWIALIREKPKVEAALPRLWKIQFVLERVCARLAVLKDYYEEGYGRGDLGSGESALQFFQSFERDRPELERKMAWVRKVVRLYTLRNGGRLLTVALGGNEDSFPDE
jgi:hypothetical protein